MQVKKYFEKKVSLFSTSDVRYDGELYTVDPAEQSIALKHVNCMGTEGRRSGDQAIQPSDCTYEFIIFRAVNIRELYLDLGNGQRRDLTDELLMPLRTGQRHPYSSKPRQQDMEYQDAPKRKVGYQSRSNQQGQQQQYYDQQGGRYGGGGYRRGSYDPNRSRRGYEDAPYPPYGNYRRPQYDAYYDAPPPNGYYQRGYGRQRAPQYYNAPYYDQGYGYNGYRRYRQQAPPQNRGYRNNNRGYGQQQQQRGYNRQNRGPPSQQAKNGTQAGTGAYLDSARLRGDEIDIKDQQDFDFGAAKNEFDLNDAEKNAAHGLIVGKIVDKKDKEQVADGDDEETKAADDSKDKSAPKEEKKKYDAAKSFFDGLQTETKKSKPRQDMQTQKEVDTSTFGTIAGQYQSRHMQQKRGYRRNNYNRNNKNNYNRSRPQQSQQQQSQSNGYGGGNRWVRK